MGINSKKFETIRFLIIGIITVIIDFIIYILLLSNNFSIVFSKLLAFITGAIFSYFFNKSWTFKSYGSRRTIIKFIITYLNALIINVSMNNLLLSISKGGKTSIYFAFIISTLVSALFNYVCMSRLVFTRRIQ